MQSGGGGLVVAALLGLLTWVSKSRDSLRRAERNLRIELREDLTELKRLNDALELDIISLHEAMRMCQKESSARQEEIFALKESILRIKNDFWTQYNSDRAKEKKEN